VDQHELPATFLASHVHRLYDRAERWGVSVLFPLKSCNHFYRPVEYLDPTHLLCLFYESTQKFHQIFRLWRPFEHQLRLPAARPHYLDPYRPEILWNPSWILHKVYRWSKVCDAFLVEPLWLLGSRRCLPPTLLCHIWRWWWKNRAVS
jgi:hypothetical protein